MGLARHGVVSGGFRLSRRNGFTALAVLAALGTAAGLGLVAAHRAPSSRNASSVSSDAVTPAGSTRAAGPDTAVPADAVGPPPCTAGSGSGCVAPVGVNLGDLVPDTTYPVPAGAVFLATNGRDTNPGTQAAPVVTLAKAMALVPAGGTIVVRAGTYRPAVTVQPSRRFTLQPYPHEQVWFDGMVNAPATGWRAEPSGRWSIEWKTPDFCGGKYYSAPFRGQTTPTCSWGEKPGNPADNDYGDAQNPMATDPQMVYLNGSYAREVASLDQVTRDSFFYAQDTRRVYIGTDPSAAKVEITRNATVLRIQNPNAAGSTIRGVGFQRYATDIYSANTTHGAVLLGVPGITLENNVFARMAGTGVMITDPTNVVVRSNVFAFNGFDGLEVNGHSVSSPDAIDNLLVEKNVFNANNSERFGCGYACGRANMKFTHVNQGTVRGNLFENGVAGAPGFWCDENCNRMTIVNNVMRGNGGSGMFFEVSNSSTIASNLIVNNGSGLRLAAANTRVFNNTIVGNGGGVIVYDDSRALDPRGRYGPNTANNEFVNNIVGSTGGRDACGRIALLDACNAGGQTSADSYFAAGGLDYTVYVRTNGAPTSLALWQTSSRTTNTFSTLAAFRSTTGKEPNGRELTSANDPLFANPAGGDYRIVAGSAAKARCRALPGDVAAAIGVPGGRPVDCGVLRGPTLPS